MKWYQRALVRLAMVAALLSLAPLVHAACDLQFVSVGPCLGNGTAGTPKVGDLYGIKATINIKGTPAKPFLVVWTMANVSFTNTISGGAGNYTYYFDWAMELDDPIPWSVVLDPTDVSGNTNTANNTASGTFTPTPPATVVELYNPQIWSGEETSLLEYQPGSGTLDFYVLFGIPTTHGAQSVISVSVPANSQTIVTAPYAEAVSQITRTNVEAAIFQDSNSFVMQCNSIRVNPTILRTNTWADMAAMSTNWTIWLAPDARCQSTDPVISNFVQQSLPADYKTTMTPYDTARTLHKAVMKALVYEEPPPAIDAVSVLEDGIGDCGGYAALLTASLRNAGIPARCVSGFRQGEQIPHCRTEFHLPGTDWMVADPTDGYDFDPTGTYAYDFGVVPDGNEYVAVDYGDAHVFPYNTFELIQVPNIWVVSGNATFISDTNTYALTAVPGIAMLPIPSDGGTVTGIGVYTAGASVSISATPSNGWSFTGWTDGSTANPRTVTVPANGTNFIANFTQQAVQVVEISLSGNLAVGSIATGATTTATLTINNPGTVALVVSNITYPTGYSGAFSGTIQPSGSTNVIVTFTPPSIGVFSGTVTVNSDATEGTDTIAASGTGAAAVAQPIEINVSGTLTFGNVVTGATATASLTISNPGSTVLTVSSITYPAGFSGAFSGTIQPSGSQPVTVTFAPSALGAASGSVTVNSDATEGTDSVNASGTGVGTIPSNIATPTITPDGGDLADSVKVTLKCATAKAVIYYTIDGSTPSTSSLKYKSAITLTNSATINAVAYVGTNGPSATASASFTISRPSITTAALLPSATAGTEYSTTLAGMGGTAPYKWKLVASKLPTGLKLASTGTITGTPKAVTTGPVTITVELTDAKKGIAEQTFTLTVN